MSVLRFLATGDLQIHQWRQFSTTTKSGMNSRLANCLKVFDIILREAKARKIRKVLINGDIFEESDYIPVETYVETYRKLEKLHEEGLEVVLNIGNHDIASASTARLLHSLRPFRKVAHIVETPEVVWDRVFIFPYEPDSDAFKSRLQETYPSGSSILVLHSAVQGGHVGPKDYLVRCPVKLADLHPKRWRLILLSDFHTAQFLRKNVLYMGSPLQHTFGENHRPCIWDVSLTNEVKLCKVYTNLPRFKRVRARRREEIEVELRALQGNYIRIILPSGSKVSDDDVEELARRGKFLYQIEREGEKGSMNEEASIRTLDARELISRYVESNVRSKARTRRLISMGTALYEGKAE